MSGTEQRNFIHKIDNYRKKGHHNNKGHHRHSHDSDPRKVFHNSSIPPPPPSYSQNQSQGPSQEPRPDYSPQNPNPTVYYGNTTTNSAAPSQAKETGRITAQGPASPPPPPKEEYPGALNLNTRLWGPGAWEFIHAVALGYPPHATHDNFEDYKQFFWSMQKVLPCEKCRVSFRKHLGGRGLNESLSKGPDQLFDWTVQVRNKISLEVDPKKEPIHPKRLKEEILSINKDLNNQHNKHNKHNKHNPKKRRESFGNEFKYDGKKAESYTIGNFFLDQFKFLASL